MATTQTPPVALKVKSTPFVNRFAVLIVLLYSVGLLVVGSALRVQYGFPLDDSWIHQTVARNFAHFGTLGFSPGKPSSGATSLLWACLQAANYRTLHLDPVVFNLILGWLTLVLIGLLLFLLARRDGFSPRDSFILAAAPALCGNFIWLALIGMEHLLFVVLTLGSIYFWFDIGVHRRRSAILAGLGAGLLLLTRPEAMLFGPLLALTGRKIKRTLPQTLLALAVWSMFLAVLFAANFHTSHSLMPVTLKGRTWLYFRDLGGPHSIYSILSFFFSWMRRPAMQFSTWWAQPMPGSGSVLLHVLPPLALAGLGAWAIFSRRAPRIRFLMLWAAVHFCTYLLMFPTTGHAGRYQPLFLLLLFPCLFFGLLWLLELAFSGRAHWAVYPAAAALIVAGAASLYTWRIVTVAGIAHINNTHGRMAEWMLHNLPPGANVAVFDIGRISYTWGNDLLDLGGLVDPSYVPYLTSGRVPQYLEEQKVQYVVLPKELTTELGFSDAPMTKLAEYCSSNDLWRLGFQYTGHAGRCQDLYKVK